MPSDGFTAITTSRRRTTALRPEAMMQLPENNEELVREVLKVIEICRADAGQRAAFYRQIDQMVETGKSDGMRALVNLLYSTLDRLASFLFSPSGVRFSIDFENEYGLDLLQRGVVAAQKVGRSWEQTNADTLFAQGVFEALKYGSAILKQRVRQEGKDRLPSYHADLVMPWQFGVYRPDVANLDAQPAMTETVTLTLPEVWRRIWFFPDAAALFDRIKAHAAPGVGSDIANSFFHQVLSTSPLQTTGVGSPARVQPGGIVQITNNPVATGIVGNSTAPTVIMHEVWMWNGDDYATIQIIEPDILVAPRFKRSNLLIEGAHPYTLIQPNQVHGNIWGRSEISDLIEPQDFLAQTAADIKRLFGLQVDKLLAFSGADGLTDEAYNSFRTAGYTNVGPGGSVTDLTPQFPQMALPLLDKIIQLMEMISGLDNMLSGRGEPGVRSGVQSTPLMKAAGARLRDRSLLVERQCAAAADLRFAIMQAKDGRAYWTDPQKIEETTFLLSQVPEDGRVVVDGHTTSPIFADDNLNLIMAGKRLGVVDDESFIEQLPFQNKDTLIARHKAAVSAAAAQMEALHKQNPEEWAKLMEKQAAGRKR